MSEPVIPPAIRRNHWMNQSAVHAEMKPDATAFQYVGQVTTWRQFAAIASRAERLRRVIVLGDPPADTGYGRDDPEWGEVPVAAVVVHDGAELDVATLRDWLGDELARFEHPKDLVFSDELPRNSGGTVVEGIRRAADPV